MRIESARDLRRWATHLSPACVNKTQEFRRCPALFTRMELRFLILGPWVRIPQGAPDLPYFAGSSLPAVGRRRTAFRASEAQPREYGSLFVALKD
jgi:hypothetical protein